MKKRLRELCWDAAISCGLPSVDMPLIAAYLARNGVIAPPCTVGDTMYCHLGGCFALSFQVEKIEMTENGFYFGSQDRFYWFSFEDLGKTVFHTQEEAEKALAERMINHEEK